VRVTLSLKKREVDSGLVEDLLALPTLEQGSGFLRAADLLNEDGLDRLLDVAERLLSSDPGKARRLAELCAEAADGIAAPAAVARANYIRAGAHGINGDFDAELRLNRAARDGFLALGMNLEALRTYVGRMAVLIEMGLYQEALDNGQIVLDALAGKGNLDVSPTRQQADLLTALVHQNRGGCYEYMGRYDEALDAYAIAEERYRALGMPERLGEIMDNRGAILLQLGRGNEALAAHEAAAAIFEEAGLTLSHAKALSNAGEANRRLANYAHSLNAFERARRLYDSLDALADKGLLLLDTAGAYLELNLYSEALASYREADDLLRSMGMVHDRARALWGMGSALIACRKFEKAKGCLADAAELFEAAGNVPLLSDVMLEQAALMEACGDREVALAKANRALNLTFRGDWPVQRVYAHLRLAELLLPDAAEAEPHLLAARRLADRLALPQLRYRLNERLGRLRRLQGRDEEARVLLEAGVDEIERLRGTVTHEAVRTSFLRDKTVAYEELMAVHLNQEDEEGALQAFAVAEQAKSRALADLITGVVEKESTGGSADIQLEEQIRALQADLNSTYNLLLGGDNEDGMPLQKLRRRAVELEREINRLRLRTVANTTTDPFAASMLSGRTRQETPSDVPLLAYHIVGDEIVAFVSTRDGIRVARNFGSVTAVARLLRRLNKQWNRFRPGREFAEQHMALLERSTQQVLASLYAELMSPLEVLLDEVSRSAHRGNTAPQKLVIVPHGLLHQVPFHALFDGEQYLLERFEISYAPSTRIYSLLQKRARKKSDKALVMSVADPLIPAVTDEARAVARQLPGAEVLSDRRATVNALRAKAPDCAVLHLACHGMFRADNPMFSALKLHDGWLAATEAMQLDLEGALVTLSACESGRSQIFAGDELIGLMRAFLGAGASTLGVSLWLVQDKTTAWLMEKWYEQLRDGVGRAAALRSAQLALKEKLPHPYYWAPFILIGQR
jgi:CHAT domain-containing protein/tetratricopeptide (TPR) repeat protein